MEQIPIFIPLDRIAEFPDVREVKEKNGHTSAYIDLKGRDGTLEGFCCKDFKTSEMTAYGNGLGKGEAQTLPCRFDGCDDDFRLMSGVIQSAEHRYIVLVPCKDESPLVIGNSWGEMEVVTRYNALDDTRQFVFACPYTVTALQRYQGTVEVTECTAMELMERLYGVKRENCAGTAMSQPALLWHPKSERPEDDSQVLLFDGDGYGTAGYYRKNGDYFAANSSGISMQWDEWHIDCWAYISDLVKKKWKKEGESV